jgi:Flp pilus assembly protein TadD
VLASAALLVLIAAGVVAVRQVGFWQNSETIFGHCLTVTPNNHVAHNNLGAALAQQGRTEEARAQFMVAWRLQPHDADTLYNVGLLLADQGKFEEGAPYLAEAVGTKPELGSIYGKLGMILDTRGRTAQAIACYREGMRLRPGQVDMGNNLAWILATTADARLRDGSEAVRLAQQACESSGYKQPLVVGTLAAAYAEAGRFPQAVATAEQAIALATAAGQPGLAERNRQLLELYRAGKPFREPKNGS